MIRIAGLIKRYGRLLALSAVSFDVEPGRVVGLVGPNAAGKTTTLRILAGLTAPDSGSATICGMPVRKLAHAAGTVGVVLDGGSAPGHQSIPSFLGDVARLTRSPRERVHTVVEAMGLGPVQQARYRTLSLGSRRRVMLAAALLTSPRHLVLDEPFNGLDPNTTRWLGDYLRHLADTQGTGVLLSSHLVGELSRTCHDLVVMGSGRVLFDGSVEDLRATAHHGVRVATTPREEHRLHALLTDAGYAFHTSGSQVEITGRGIDAVAETLLLSGIPLTLLEPTHTSLDDIYFSLTEGHLGLRSAHSTDQTYERTPA